MADGTQRRGNPTYSGNTAGFTLPPPHCGGHLQPPMRRLPLQVVDEAETPGRRVPTVEHLGYDNHVLGPSLEIPGGGEIGLAPLLLTNRSPEGWRLSASAEQAASS